MDFPDDDVASSMVATPALSLGPTDISIALLALMRLRRESEYFRESPRRSPVKASRFLLTAEAAAALSIAIHCVEQAAHAPARKRAVNA